MTAETLPLTAQRSTSDRVQFGIVLGASLAVRIGYLLLKPASVVSLDVGMWRQAADFILSGRNPYLTGTMVFLPLWPGLIALMAGLSRLSGWDLASFLFPLLIVAELAILTVSFRILRGAVSSTSARNILLIAIALNPAAIFQVTQHGNIDVLMMIWVMLAIGALIRFHEHSDSRDWLWACLWLGMGILTKTAPIALAPLLAAGASKLPRRTLAKGLLLLIAPAAVGLAILIPTTPMEYWKGVLVYRSVHGYFGLSGLMGMIDGVEFPAVGPMLRLQARLFNIGLPAAMVLTAFLLWRRGWRGAHEIPLVAALGLISILIFGTGFGPQHIYWLIPTLAISWGMIASRSWRRLLILGWVVIAGSYTFEYLILSSHGQLLRTLYPKSELLYRVSLQWLTPGDQTIMRLPMFCVFVAILIQGIREFRGTNDIDRQSASAAG